MFKHKEISGEAFKIYDEIMRCSFTTTKRLKSWVLEYIVFVWSLLDYMHYVKIELTQMSMDMFLNIEQA